MSLASLLATLHHVRTEDEDAARRGRSLITICLATLAVMAFCVVLTPFVAPPQRQIPTYILATLLISIKIAGILLARAGRVDTGGLIVSAGWSLALAGYQLHVQSYTYIFWFTALTVVIAAISVRPALIWACAALNICLVVALYLLIPADPADPADKARLSILLSALLLMVATVTYLSASRTRALLHAQAQTTRDLMATRDQLAVALDEAHSARDRAEAASRAKSTFLANMSHELRTPLNAIIGYSELISEETQDEVTLEDLHKIRASGRHLLAIIDDLLDLSRIEAGKLAVHPEPVEVTALIAHVAQLLGPALLRNQNMITLDIAPDVSTLTTDRTRLQQILLNLASNAAKFTERGTITIAARRAGERLVFEVRDTGIGMDEATLERVFGEFVQADASTTRKYGGTGLGLPLSRKLAQLLGGDVTATSRPGQGSTFTLSLPAP